MQAIVPLPKGTGADTVRVWFVPQDTPYFYWLIPESSERGALGVIGESGPETRRGLEQFLEKRKLDPIEFQGARVPVPPLDSGAAGLVEAPSILWGTRRDRLRCRVGGNCHGISWHWELPS